MRTLGEAGSGRLALLKTMLKRIAKKDPSRTSQQNSNSG